MNVSNHHKPKIPRDAILRYILEHWEIVPSEGKIYTNHGGSRREVGSIHNGYMMAVIDLDGQRSYINQSHLIWWAHYGVWPTTMLDHGDLDRANNKIGNLSEATYSSNSLNHPRCSTRTLPRGVSLYKGRCYAAQIKMPDKHYHLGYYDTPEEASTIFEKVRAFREAGGRLHGKFDRKAWK